jgi:hypothetical protein
MKRILLSILLLSIVLGSAAQHTVYAEDNDPCNNLKDDAKTWCQIKHIASIAKDLTDYYTGATKALDVGKQLVMALGWIPTHPDVSLNDLQNQIQNLGDGLNWKETVDFISGFHPHSAFAIQQLAQDKTYALSNRDYPTTTWSLDGPWTFADPITEGPFYRPFKYPAERLLPPLCRGFRHATR